jgi:hypothetical protein
MKDEQEIPTIIQLLWDCHVIGPSEVRLLMNKIQEHPSMSESRLILESGYVTKRQLESLQLAASLLAQTPRSESI